MKAKRSSYKTFQLDKNVSVECNYYETRYSWGHEANLYIDGRFHTYKKITYYNRTWEAYTYQTILQSIVDSVKAISKEDKAKYKAIIADQSFSQDRDIFKSIAFVAKIGEVLTSNQKEANDWKARMLKAGPSDKGLIMPADWDQLDDNEKQKRLDAVIKLISK